MIQNLLRRRMMAKDGHGYAIDYLSYMSLLNTQEDTPPESAYLSDSLTFDPDTGPFTLVDAQKRK